jgi:hypothetical protein
MNKDAIRDLFAAMVLPEVYRGSIELGQVEQKAIAEEAFEMADAMMAARGSAESALQAKVARLKRTIAAFKANSTRRKARHERLA